MTPTCYSPGKDAPRILRDRHHRDCNLSGCPGCQPCTERHCQLCDREHVTVDGKGHDQTCATCLSRVRDHLAGIWSMSTRLLGEALRHGINAHATTLAGPTADPETWGYRRMSALAGRTDPTWLTDQVDISHPLWVLGTWEHETRLHLDQLLHPGHRSTLSEARDYLDHHLTWLSHDPTFAFEELDADIEACHHHLESVLSEGDRPDTGAPCPICGKADLVKDYGTEVDDDVMWHCPRCHQWWTDHDYRTKLLGVYVGVAPHLTASQIAEQYRVPSGTIRQWVARGKVARRGRDSSGRQLYDVQQVLAARDAS